MDGARKSRGLFDSSIASCFSRCFPSAILLLAKSKTGYGELVLDHKDVILEKTKVLFAIENILYL
jgi:hypothetical protein